jgi:GTP cyclohydrolase I
MQDIQTHPAEVPVPIERVGVRGVSLPVVVRDRVAGRQHTVARVDLGVDLPADFKGTHMSRFIEALENFSEELDYQSLRRLLEDVRERLTARRAYICLEFPYFITKTAPDTGSVSRLRYDCRLTGELEQGGPEVSLEVDVPVMTVCPCSKAISAQGAHSQRALVRIAVRMNGFIWIEDFVDIAEAAGSSPVYTLLKRADEKFVTERAFANPAFVEDVVRVVAQSLAGHPLVASFRVEVESFESIHAHNAFARITGGCACLR